MTRHRKACCQIGITTWSGNSVEDEGLIISSASWSNGSEGRPTSTFCFSPLSDIYHAPSLNQARSSQYGGKFNDLAWTSFVSAACPSSILVAGGEDGLVSVYDSSYIVQGGECEMLAENRYHTGSVLSVNISKVDSRWLCSGDANGTVLLWDLTKPSYPMSLGRAYTASSLKQVAWNRCEMSVLASVLDNCVCVRDCRQPESTVLCLADQKHCVDSIWRCMSWHPHNSFSLCVASQNEDSTIQLWDMRFTSIPMFSYRPHSKGIYAIDWCPFDPAYLVSGGADSHILFHDPTNGRGVGICTAKGWVCQLMWCCRDPSLLAVSYYNEPVEVLSLLPLTSSMPSFADQWNDSEDFHLAVPASWMSTGSSGATFSFGKKLCCFAVSDEKNVSRSTVEIQKVDPDPFIHRAATSILYALEQNELLSFCDEQIRNCESCEFTLIWQYLRDAADSDTHRNRVTRIKKEISQRLDENVKKSVSQISGVEWNAVISNDFALVRNSLSSEAHNETNCASVKSDVELRTLSDEEILSVLALCADIALDVAIEQKNWLLSLLISTLENKNHRIRDIADQMSDDSSLSHATIITSMIIAGSWKELVETWSIEDWRTILALLLQYEYGQQRFKICRALASRLLKSGKCIESACVSVIGQDIESFTNSVKHLSLYQRFSMSAVLRQASGGGSARIVPCGERFTHTLLDYFNELVNEGLTDVCKKLLHVCCANELSEELRQLDYSLCLADGSSFQEPIAKRERELLHRQSGSNVNSQFPFQSRNNYQSLTTSCMQQSPCPTSGNYAPAYQWSKAQQNPEMTSQPASASHHFYSAKFSSYSVPPPPQVVRHQNPASFFHQHCLHPSISSSIHSPNFSASSAVSQMFQCGYAPPPPSQNTNFTPVRHSVHYGKEDLTSAEAVSTVYDSNAPSQSSTHPLDFGHMLADGSIPLTESSALAHSRPESSSLKTEKAEELGVHLLKDSDTFLVTTMQGILTSIRNNTTDSVMTRRIDDLEHKLTGLVIPHLANSSFSERISSLLQTLAVTAAKYDFGRCQALCAYLAQSSHGNDFVQISAILPTLKSFFSVARIIFG